VQTLRETIAGAGQVVPAANGDWRVLAAEPAMIAEVTKMAGDPVEAGEVLVRFEVASLTQNYNARQLAAAEAAARTDRARAEVDRLTPLYDQGVIPRTMLDQARAELSTAQAAQASAGAYLEEARVMRNAATTVTARFDGIVAERWHNEGEFVTGEDSDPVLRVIDPTRLEIALVVPNEQAMRIREGLSANVQTLTGDSIVATVARRPLGLRLDPTMSDVRLAPPSLEGLALNDAVRVELVLDERPDALVVPAETIVRELGGMPHVMVVDENGIVRRRPVRLGLTTGGLTQVVDGLLPGERVVLQGLAEVVDGMAVSVSR
jgi:RND family efflux transporter MFP subunit